MPRLELVEPSLRHGQQSLMVSRLRLRHALPVAETLDHCGFAALDVFGGSTFEASLRFLAEDPFERLRAIRAAAPITPLLAVIAGQSLVGHRQVPDDLVDAFIETSAAAGVDIFRCYDPLNHVRNLERCATAIAGTGKQAEGVIVYNEVPGRGLDGLGDVARRLVDAGYPTICLHDPLGVLGAAAAARAVTVIREAAGVPVAVSISAQTGMAALACHSAAGAGAYRADCALSPLAGGASMPGAEALVAGFAGTEVDCGLDLERIAAAALVLKRELVHYADVLDPPAPRPHPRPASRPSPHVTPARPAPPFGHGARHGRAPRAQRARPARRGRGRRRPGPGRTRVSATDHAAHRDHGDAGRLQRRGRRPLRNHQPGDQGLLPRPLWRAPRTG